MTTPTSLNRFETELLVELRRHVAERAPQQRPVRRRGRHRLVAVATSAATAAALTVGGLALRPDVAAAYSLVQQRDGDIVVTIHDMSDANGLEAALAEHGVTADVSYDLDMNGIAVVDENGDPATALPNPPAAPDCWPVGVDVKPAGDGAVTFTVQARYVGSDTVLHLHTGGSADSTLGVSVEWENPNC
jgi:hypothetical protein